MEIREILAANSQKTIQMQVRTKKGVVNSSVPVRKNGIYRIHHLSNGDTAKKFLDVKRHFLNNTFDDIEEVDSFLRSIDISPDFREIGGNLAFTLSSALLKSFSQFHGLEVYEYLTKGKPDVPSPIGIIADKQIQTDFNEYMLYPVQKASFSDGIQKILSAYNDFVATFQREKNPTINKIFKMLSQSTTKHALQIGVNLGATKLWNTRRYVYGTGENLTPQEQILFIQDLAQNYPVGYFEDPFHEEDFVLHATLTHRLPTRTVAGNELYSNNPERIRTGVELKATNGVVLTPSEMGTVSDLIKTVKELRRRRMSVIVGMPDNETDDLVACQLAVGLGCEYMKLGLSNHHINKINELMRIEEKTK